MSTSESRLVITVDSRTAEQRAKDTARALEDLERHGLGAQVGVQQMNRALNDTSRSAGDAAAAVRRMVTGALAGLSAMKVIDIADEWGQYASRIKMATESTQEYERVQARMLQSSQATFRHINETREAFIQLSPVLRQMGMSLDESMDAIDAFSGLLVTNAASGDRAAAAMRALSISFQKGKIDADQWMTIYSTLDSVVDVIAANTGRAADEVRRLGAEGKLSVREFAEALSGQYANIMQQVEEMPTTVRDAMTNVASAFGEYIGKANEVNGVTATLADGIAFVGENIDTVMTAALTAGGVALAAYTSRTIGSTAATVADMVAKRAAAVQERDLAAAQAQAAAATLAHAQAAGTITPNLVQQTAAANALTAAQHRLATAQAGVSSASKMALGLLGGPVGLIATLGLTVAGFAAIDGAAARSKISLDILNGTVEDAVAKFSKLAESQRRAALAISEANYAKALKGFDDALREIEQGSLADGTRAVAQWRAASSQAIREVANAARAGAISYEEMDSKIVQMIESYAQANGRSKEWVAQQIEIASRVTGAGQAAGQAKSMMDELTAAHDRLSASAANAAGGVSALNNALTQTDGAGKKYLEQLSDRALIAGLKTQREQLDALVKAGKLVFAPEDLERAQKAADRIDTANKAAKGLTTSLSEAARAAKQLNEWLAEQKISTASTEAMTAAYVKGGAAISELTRRQKAEEQVLKSGEKARAAITAAVNAYGRAVDRLDVAKQIDELRRQNAAGTAYLEVLNAQSVGLFEGQAALEAYNAEQALNALLLGKSAEEVADLTAKFRELWAEHAGITRQTQALQDLNQLVDGTRTKQEAYAAELVRLQGLRAYAKTAAQVEALDRAIKQVNRENSVWFEFTEKALDRIDESFASMWTGFIEGSESAFAVVKGGFNQMLAEMAHAAITRPITISLGNAIMGTSNPGGWADVWGGGASTGIGQGVGVVNSIRTAWGALSGGLTSTLATGVAKIGGAIGSQALTSFASGLGGAMGPAAPGMAGFMSAGSAVGTALPWVAGGLAAYGLISSIFGNKAETRTGAQYGLAINGQLYNPRRGTTNASADGVQFLEGPSGGGASAAVQQAIQGTVDGINGLFKTIGSDISLAAFWAGFEGSEKGRGGVGAGGILSSGFRFGEQGTGDNYRGTLFDPSRPGSLSPEEALNMLPAQLAQASLQAWQSAAEMMPPALAHILQGADLAGMGDDALIALRDQFVASVAQAEMLRIAMADLPFAAAAARTFEFAAALADAAGGAENAASLLGSFYQNYYSEAERAAWLTEQLTGQFAELGFALPQTREEFRGLVEANMALGEGGARTAAQLLSMESALSSLLPAFEAVVEVVEEVIDPIVALNAAMDSQLDVVRAIGAEANRLRGLRTTAGSIVDQIDAALGRTEQFAARYEGELWAALGTGSYEQQIGLAEELTGIVLDRYNGEIQAAEQLRDLGRSIRDYVQGLRVGDLSPATLGDRLAEAGRQYADALALARGGDLDAMGDLQGLADSYLRLARDYYASGSQYTSIFDSVTGGLDALGIQAETDAERQLGVSQDTLAQLERLHGVAEQAYGAIDAQYQAALLASQNELAVLTAMASDTDRLHDVANLLQGMPAGIAAALQPILSAAMGSVVSGWYADAGYGMGDQAGRDYWQGQLGQRPADQVKDDFNASLVTGWYQQYLNRLPDAAGLAHWMEDIEQFGAQGALAAFLASAGVNGSHRNGLDYVPFDGYRAELHQGERVLTAAENRAYTTDWSRYGQDGGMQALVAEVRQLRQQQERSDATIAQLLQLIAQLTQANPDLIVEGLGGAIRETGRRAELAARK